MSLGALAFLGFVMMTSLRINLSVAIVAMVRQNNTNAIKTRTECIQGEEEEEEEEEEVEVVIQHACDVMLAFIIY